MKKGEHIKKRRLEVGIRSAAELARRIGVSQQSAYKWENGGGVSDEYKESVATLLEKSVEWVLNGWKDDFKESRDFFRSGNIVPYDSVDELPDDDKIVMVKFASNLSAACGSGIVNDEHIEGHNFPFYLNSLTKAGVKDSTKVIVGYANGESNAPEIPHKAAIGIDTGCTKIIHKQIYLITVDGEERLKQIISLEEGRYLMRSLNPDKTLFPDEVMDVQTMAERQIIIRGRFFWCSWLKPI